ncbi:hypothetical protein [Afifella sp. IM 167]|uniref:Dyp-type peroxidase n=1 Tax=Afifella sp. IM 167 TaxID=2033586 RepID=UPI001CCE8055|nr:hypothetical protein [Afifella sp. IM 167]MBZ8132155.1 hypothetical protein [Afifella sp. IM 167]
MPHSFLTIAIPFPARYRGDVEAELDRIGNPAGPSIATALNETAFVHFMSIWIAPEWEGRCHVILEVNADGTVAQVCEKLAEAIGDEILRICRTAHAELGHSPLPRFLEHAHRPVGQGWFDTPGVNFDGTPGLTVRQVRQEADLAARVATMIENIHEPTALATLNAVRGRLWDEESLKWAFTAAPAPSLQDRPPRSEIIRPILSSAVASFLWPFLLFDLLFFLVLLLLAGMSAAGLSFALVGTAIALLLQVAAIGGLYAALRRAERTDLPEDLPPNPHHVGEYMKREGHAAQSHLASSSVMKPGRLRHLALRVGLWVAGTLGAHFSRPGFLSNTGVIHFARWILLPGTNQLLFMSNYDGAWESYLEDFIERAARGVTGIWSNTRGFPRTTSLLGGGARDGDRLRRWSRRQQQVTWVWYSAYPQLTLNRIRTNCAIRQGIAHAGTEAEAADWLASFGSTPRTPSALEDADIPTLVFGGLGFLRHSRALFLRFCDDPQKCAEYLQRLDDRLGYGDTRGLPGTSMLALSPSGLSRLGMREADLATFPVAFQHGMAAGHRARVLGDVGESAPEAWQWGRPGEEIDAILILYEKGSDENETEGEERLDARVATIRDELDEFGHALIHELPLQPLPAMGHGGNVTEPFGFVDGISQPLIKGTPQARSRARRHHVVEAGEFVLGYPDNLGYLPATPSVAGEQDPQHLLPALGADPFRPRPSYLPPAPAARHDIGRNGTYLVVRQLEQDRDAFEGFLDRAAGHLAGNPKLAGLEGEALRDWIAGKAVGRWRNGAALVRHPRQAGGTGEAAKLENDFLFGEEDASGLACPLGSHIRRSNPRESFVPGDAGQLAISNRHRILRVGRPYRGHGEGGKAGILFMCLNTDIERQFEFIQQTWLLGKSFHGLEDEVDPVLGPPSGEGAFTIPTPRGPVRVPGLTRFVTVRGGGYFFVPGRRALRYLASTSRPMARVAASADRQSSSAAPDAGRSAAPAPEAASRELA